MAPFGTRGEVRVRPETDFPERFVGLREVCLELPEGRAEMARVVQARITPKGALVQFEGCADRTQAEALRGAWVKIRLSMAIPLPEGSYYIHEIVGLRVLTEEGGDLGEVTEVIRSPANDVYVTETTMIPAVREVVREISLEKGTMTVALPPEGPPDAAGMPRPSGQGHTRPTKGDRRRAD